MKRKRYTDEQIAYAAQQAKASAGWHFTRLDFVAVWPAVGGESDIYAVSR